MAVSTIKTTQMTWGFLNSRLNREPIDAASLNNSYTDLLWELNQTSSTYELGKSNTGGSSNFYVGLITSVPYVNKGHGKNEDSSLKGPWYVTYCGSDPNEGTGKYAFTGHIDDPINAANTYYADRIVLKRELDYALDKNTVSPLLLGTYYTGVGHWYDSYTKSKEYRDKNKELPDGIYFPTTSYAEIFNDYTNNVATDEFSHAEGVRTTASGYASHAEGNSTTASGHGSHAEGIITIARGVRSHAEGYDTIASGWASHAEGNGTHATGDSSHAEGCFTYTIGENSHTEGYYTYAIGLDSHAEGKKTIAYGSYTHAEGYYSYAEGTYSHAEGTYTYAIGENSHAEGSYTYAKGNNSHAEGWSTTASGWLSHAEGENTTASGEISHTEGFRTTASGTASHAEGEITTASGNQSHAEGYNTAANGNSSHAEGYSTKTIGRSSHAEGKYTTADGDSSHAEGTYTYTIGDSSHVEGINSYSYGLCSHAEGGSVIAYGSYTHAEGYYSYAEGTYSHTEGSYTYAIGENSHAEGYNSYAIGNNSHAEGDGSTASGEKSHAEGESTMASGHASHAEGDSTTASGRYSHAEGDGTTASGYVSHAEGAATTASGERSHAEGGWTKANGGYSHAEGIFTEASGHASHAEGENTTASGYDSHAEGDYSTASGEKSHAEGNSTTASGMASHAEGYGTIASGWASHAEGYGTTAAGNSSHAEGYSTKTYNESEHAQGKYNVSDTENSGTLFTIGNGTADDKRHNVIGIYHNGDINIEGQNTTNHNIGYFKSTIDGDYTQTIGTVGKNNASNVTINGTSDTRISGATYEGYDSTFISTTKDAKSTYSYSTTYIYSKGNVTNTTDGTRTVITDGDVSITNKSNIGTYTTGTTYQYVDSNKTDVVGGTRNDITNGNVTIINKANIDIATNGTHTENIDTTRSVVVGAHDSLVVNSNGRTEKITGEKITQVVSGNINTYTDNTHDTRLNTRSTYIETIHAYIGDNTNTTIDGNYSIGLGQGIKVSSDTNVTVGKYNKDEASYFAVGIGTDNANRKNAFWISQSKDAGSNGICYFSDDIYVYSNTYDPGQYPDNKEDKSWSTIVTYNMYKNSYAYLYNTINDKFNTTFGDQTYFTKSIDPFTYTSVSYTLHYTTQSFNKEENNWTITKHQYELSQAIPGALENDNSGMAGLMSARDKARLDSIWEGDKQIAGIQISTGSWEVFKNDGTTAYTLSDIKHQSNSIANLQIEYGFKPKWSGTWKWTVNNQKNAERCAGTWGKDLPDVNTDSDVWTSPVLTTTGQLCSQTIFAKKRGLIISGYPDNFAGSSNGTRHLGSIVPASGEDNRYCSVIWNTYRLLFYGKCTQDEADRMDIDVMKDLLANTRYSAPITGRSWTINYKSDPNTCFFMAYPTYFKPISAIKKNGVEIITSSFIKVGTVNYTNGAGLTQQYYVYRSGVGAAGMSITIS